MKIIFLGNADPYLPILQEAGRLALVVCEPVGCIEEQYFGSAFAFSQKNGIRTATVRDYFESPVHADLIVASGCRYKIPKNVIGLPNVGIVNIHQSLLPKYRGRHPLNWAIINGEKVTGTTVHHVNENIDDGSIIFQEKVEISNRDTIMDLYYRTLTIGKRLLVDTINAIGTDAFKGTPQDISQASFYPARTPEDGLINWNESAEKICDLVRALVYPYPGAYYYDDNAQCIIDEAEISTEQYGFFEERGKVVKHGDSLFVKTGDGILKIVRIRQSS